MSAELIQQTISIDARRFITATAGVPDYHLAAMVAPGSILNNLCAAIRFAASSATPELAEQRLAQGADPITARLTAELAAATAMVEFARDNLT